MFSNIDIEESLKNDELRINPFSVRNLQANSYDIHLAPVLSSLDGKKKKIYPGNDKMVISAGEFVLGASLEKIELSNKIAAILHTRSSIGRLGISTHATAGLIDAGFHGSITFEITNFSDKDIELDLDIPVAQLTFHKLDTPTDKPYNGDYNGQIEPTISKYWR